MMGRGKSAVKKRAKRIREKNEANLQKIRELGELRTWNTNIITTKRAPRYVG